MGNDWMKRFGQVWPVLWLVTAALLAAVTATAQEAEEVLLYEQAFDGGDAQGWELAPGWTVTQDGENWILSGKGHEWALPHRHYPGDFRVGFRLKLVQGSIHLVYRLGRTGRYFIGFHEGGSHLSKQYWPDTFAGDLAVSSRAHRLGEWHEVEIAGQGALLRFLVDGEAEWEYTDPEPLLDGSFAFETLEDAVAYIDDIAVYGPAPAPTPTPDPRLSWVRTGGPLGGLGYDVRMRPDNPDVMYVTDALAGVFKSADGGQTWFPSNTGITTRVGESGDVVPVFCLTLDPHDHDIIWAGTQNVRGIFKSTDGGQTWVEMDEGVVEREGITFRGFAVDPRSSDIVYAAAELASWVWSEEPRAGREFDMTGGVVYKTTDGGQHWTAVWRGDNLARYVWIDPRDADVVYVSTGIFDREAANSDPEKGIPGGEGVLKSTDGGQTWSRANGGLGNLYVGSLFMHPENPDVLLAGTGNNQYPDGSGVYLSSDGGSSWQQTLQGDNINAVEFARSDPGIAYAGSASAIHRSEDGGHAWERVSGSEDGWGPPGVRAGFPIDLEVDPRDPNRIFANEYGGGNFVSVDGGRTWAVASTGYTGAQVRGIAVDSVGRIYAAARSGLFVSEDGGQSWIGLNHPPAFSMEWHAIAPDPSDRDRLLAANNWNGVLLESPDGGRTWRSVSQPAGEMQGWRTVVFADREGQIAYAGTSAFYSAGTFDDLLPASGVYVSRDGGKTWRAAIDALSSDANVMDLAVEPGDPQTVYAATGNKGLLKSTDGGQRWSAVEKGLPPSPSVLAVAVHPSDPHRVYAGLAFGGVYRSDDAGATWQLSSSGLNPEAVVSDIIFDPSDRDALYAADRFSGVYRSEDGGATWIPINSGLTMRAVNKLAISHDGKHLYAGTEGGGVFRLDLDSYAPQRAPGTVGTPTAEPTGDDARLPDTPTPEPAPGGSGGGSCGVAVLLSVVLLALVWVRRR
jgi:photosystem II stability/assembly factor-like uncharacterized protein